MPRSRIRARLRATRSTSPTGGAGSRPLRGGPACSRRPTSRRARALAGDPRAPLPRASVVAGPGRAARAFRASHFEHDPALRFEVAVARRTPTRAAPSRAGGRPRSPSARRARDRDGPAGQRRRDDDLQPDRPRRDPVRGRAAAARRLLDGRLRGRPVHPVPRRHERHRDLRRRPLPRSTPRSRPTSAATRRAAR